MFTKLKSIFCGGILAGTLAFAPTAQAASYIFTTTGADYSVSALFDQAGLTPYISSNSVEYSGTEAVTLTVSMDGITRITTFDAGIDLYLQAESDSFGNYGDAYLAIDDLFGGHMYEEVGSNVNAFPGITDDFFYKLVAGDYGHIDINGLADLINWSDSPETVSLKTVPEPAALGLLGLGLAGIAFLRRRKMV